MEVSSGNQGGALQYLAQREQQLIPDDIFAGQNFIIFRSEFLSETCRYSFYAKENQSINGKKKSITSVSKRQIKSSNPYSLYLINSCKKQEYLCGAFSIVDCAYAPWLPYLDLQGWDSLLEYREKIRQRCSWKACKFRD